MQAPGKLSKWMHFARASLVNFEQLSPLRTVPIGRIFFRMVAIGSIMHHCAALRTVLIGPILRNDAQMNQ